MDQELRHVCGANDRIAVAKEHKHLCDGCGTCWKHSNDIPGTTTTKQFNVAHSCPNCGERQTDKHHTREDERAIDEYGDQLIAELLELKPRRRAYK